MTQKGKRHKGQERSANKEDFIKKKTIKSWLFQTSTGSDFITVKTSMKSTGLVKSLKSFWLYSYYTSSDVHFPKQSHLEVFVQFEC